MSILERPFYFVKAQFSPFVPHVTPSTLPKRSEGPSPEPKAGGGEGSASLALGAGVLGPPKCDCQISLLGPMH
jgi:hypothetical protein